MTVQRMKWLLLGVPGIVLMTWMTLALQTRKVDDNALKNAAKGGEWLTYGQSWSEQRHSTLTQITPANVNRLGLAWSYEIGEGGGKQEGTPLFANGVIYGSNQLEHHVRGRCAHRQGNLALRPEGGSHYDRARPVEALLRRPQPRHRAVRRQGPRSRRGRPNRSGRCRNRKAALVFPGDSQAGAR